MITEAIMKVLGGLLAFLVGLMPDLTPPAWMTDTTTWLAEGLASAAAFAWFLPVVAIGQSFVFLGVCILIVWAVRALRIAISALTGGGGSAA